MTFTQFELTKEFLSRSKDETREIARQVASQVGRGGLIALTGTLGAGKTEFVRGVADVFNCAERVTSPTFTIVNVYHGSLFGAPIEINHFDFYRIESADELYSMGFEEYFYGDGVTVVEWAERFASIVPPSATRVRMEFAGDAENESRRIVIENYPSGMIRR